MDIERLNREMESRGVSVNELAKRTGIERCALYRRFEGEGRKFTVEEAKKIANALELGREIATLIFLA